MNIDVFSNRYENTDTTIVIFLYIIILLNLIENFIATQYLKSYYQ